MANRNVFGVPIDDKQKSRSENADSAKNNDKVGNKFDNAVKYVNDEKANFGGGPSTRCIFYNATGDTLKTDPTDHNYDGKIYDSYPLEVKNGQWGAFLHVGNRSPNPATGSKAYVAYRAKANNDVDFCKSLIGWETPHKVSPDTDTDTDTHAFCVVFDDADDINNDKISEDIKNAPKETACIPYKGITMTANIEAGTSPLLIVKFLLN